MGLDGPASAQSLDAAVGVNCAESDGVGKIGLGDRQDERPPVAQSYLLETRVELQQQVGDASDGRAPSHVDRPFAEDRCVNQGVEPESAAPFRVVRREIEDVLAGDCDDGGRSVRPDPAIRNGK